jgi:hypothetical protein
MSFLKSFDRLIYKVGPKKDPQVLYEVDAPKAIKADHDKFSEIRFEIVNEKRNEAIRTSNILVSPVSQLITPSIRTVRVIKKNNNSFIRPQTQPVVQKVIIREHIEYIAYREPFPNNKTKFPIVVSRKMRIFYQKKNLYFS